MSQITLGRYIPYDSVIHRCDPRAKIIAMMVVLIAIFFPVGWYGYATLFVIAFSILHIAKLKFSFILKSMKPMLWMFVFLLIINILAVQSGEILVQWYIFTVYSDAIFQTLYIVVRLMLMIMITTCLTATTKPLDMTLGIEDLLSPMKKIGVPAHEIAMLISIALRFIPDLIDETTRIMKAQQSRGVDMQEGKLKEKVMAILSLIVPLFVSAMQRAEDLADAMEARGYIPGQPRTRYKVLKLHMRDYVLMLCSVVIFVVMIGLSL